MIRNSMRTTMINKAHIGNDPYAYESTSIGSANGTFGELLQGFLPNNEHFLVTMPIAAFSRCIIVPDLSKETLEVYPPHKRKTLRLANLIIDHFVIKLTGKLIIKSELDEGKGLASSSADLVATARALEQFFNKNISVELLKKFLQQIEPSDGVMYPGCVAFYHRRVELLDYIGFLPTVSIVAIDEGGEIDTVQYNKMSRVFTPHNQIEYTELLEKITLAIKRGDLDAIGEVSTRSAIMNQVHNPKKHLPQIIHICEQIEGLGVIVAHSGTYVGILLDKMDAHFDIKLDKAIDLLARLSKKIKIYDSFNFNINRSRFNTHSHQSTYVQV